ncbi:MAG: LTA synthase family protein [Muribaculaceae bacterium]|nr:LTA synthase family protein [Muribaculaceae bacterium]
MKKLINLLYDHRLLSGRFASLFVMTFGSLLWFIIDWCMGTTFRSMSMWQLWVNNLFAAIILMLPFVITRRAWVQIAVVAVIDLILLANLIYCRTYFTGIPPESYLLVGNLADFTGSVYDSLRWRDLGFPVILIAAAIWTYRISPCPTPHLWSRWAVRAVLLGALCFIGLSVGEGFHRRYDRLIESCYTSTCGVPAYTIVGHIAYHLHQSKNASDPKVTKEIDSWLDDHNRLMPHIALSDSSAHRRNLVIILLESFESWPIGKSISGKEITPYINSLISDSTALYAPKMLTQVDAGHSIDAQLMLTAGLLPTIGNVYSTRFPDSTYPSLNKALKEAYGTKSTIFTVDQLVTWNFGVIARSFGYDNIFDRSAWKTDEKIGNPPKLSDGSFFRQSVEKLQSDSIWREGQPVMLTFVTYSGHNPFRLPDRLKDADFDLSDDNLHPTLANYLEMAHYTDSQLPALIEYLKSRADYDETIIVITGDHEGLASQRPDIRKHSEAEAVMVDEGCYTPFIVLNSPVSGYYDKVMGQIDMYPTLLSFLGLKDYSWQGIGQSILAPDKVPAAVSSMTRELAGDTTGIDKRLIEHWEKSRRISDLIIRNDYLRPDSVTQLQ